MVEFNLRQSLLFSNRQEFICYLMTHYTGRVVGKSNLWVQIFYLLGLLFKDLLVEISYINDSYSFQKPWVKLHLLKLNQATEIGVLW